MLTQSLSFDCELPLLAQFPPGINRLLVSSVSGLYLILVLNCVHVAFPQILTNCMGNFHYSSCEIWNGNFAIHMKCVDFSLTNKYLQFSRALNVQVLV